MFRPSSRLLRHLEPLTRKSHPFTAQSPATYHIGLSYASKNSPPFESPPHPFQYGFANRQSSSGFTPKITSFITDSLSRPAGRGELNEAAIGGWDERISLETRKWGAGEDFFCVVDREWMAVDYARSQVARQLHLAIADGVGGWGDTVDPSLFPQALMYWYFRHADRNSATHPREILEAAHQSVSSDPAVPAGSAPACAVALGGDGILRGINMGDSGCWILRQGEIVFGTPAGTHYFNCPKQMSKIPQDMVAGAMLSDRITDNTAADSFTASLVPGDVVILYTDGLSDNVPSAHVSLLHNQITNLLSLPSNDHLTAQERDGEMARLFADVLVGYGRMAMARTGDEQGWKTPFEVEARKEGYGFKGGKVDDITVITAVVGEQGEVEGGVDT